MTEIPECTHEDIGVDWSRMTWWCRCGYMGTMEELLESDFYDG